MASTPKQQCLLRVTILCYRNLKLTEDEFHHHWTNVHAPKVSAHLAKFGVVSYRQYHTPSSMKSTLPSSLPTLGIDESSLPDYDGFVELLMPHLSCYERALSDQYYKDVIMPDEQYFADLAKSKVTVGWEEMCIEDGNPVNMGAK